jgi:hypothetical protein
MKELASERRYTTRLELNSDENIARRIAARKVA